MADKFVPSAEHMREIAKMLSAYLPGYGFALLVFEFEKPGIGNYISNAQRADMIKALEETVTRFKAGQDFPTPEGN